MKSCLYEGRVRHRRPGPVAHALRVPALHGLPRPRRARPGVPRALALVDASGPRSRALPPRATTSATRRARSSAACATSSRRAADRRPRGPDPRCSRSCATAGFVFNPVSFYYCFDAARGAPRSASSPRSPTRPGASGTATCSPPTPATRRARCARRRRRSSTSRPFLGMELALPRGRLPRARARASRCASRSAIRAGSRSSTPRSRCERREITGRSLAAGARCATRSSRRQWLAGDLLAGPAPLRRQGRALPPASSHAPRQASETTA